MKISFISFIYLWIHTPGPKTVGAFPQSRCWGVRGEVTLVTAGTHTHPHTHTHSPCSDRCQSIVLTSAVHWVHSESTLLWRPTSSLCSLLWRQHRGATNTKSFTSPSDSCCQHYGWLSVSLVHLQPFLDISLIPVGSIQLPVLHKNALLSPGVRLLIGQNIRVHLPSTEQRRVEIRASRVPTLRGLPRGIKSPPVGERKGGKWGSNREATPPPCYEVREVNLKLRGICAGAHNVFFLLNISSWQLKGGWFTAKVSSTRHFPPHYLIPFSRTAPENIQAQLSCSDRKSHCS